MIEIKVPRIETQDSNQNTQMTEELFDAMREQAEDVEVSLCVEGERMFIQLRAKLDEGGRE